MLQKDIRTFNVCLPKSKNEPAKITRNARNPSKLFFRYFFYFAKKKQPLGNKNASRSFKYRMNLIPVKIYDQKKNHQTFIIEFRKQCSKRRAHETTRNTG